MKTNKPTEPIKEIKRIIIFPKELPKLHPLRVAFEKHIKTMTGFEPHWLERFSKHAGKEYCGIYADMNIQRFFEWYVIGMCDMKADLNKFIGAINESK